MKNKTIRNVVGFLFMSALLIEILELLIDCVFWDNFGDRHRI